MFRVNPGALDIHLDGKKYIEFKPTQPFAIPFRNVSIALNFEQGSAADIGFWRRGLWPTEINAIYRQKTSMGKVDLLQDMLTNVKLA